MDKLLIKVKGKPAKFCSGTQKTAYTKCAGCGKFLAAATSVSCTICPAMYHRCVSETKDWVCPKCIQKIRSGNNSGTPVRSVCGSVVRQIAAGSEAVPAEAESSPKSSDASIALAALNTAAAAESVSELLGELAEYVAEIRDFRREMSENRVLIDGVTARMEYVEQRIEVLEWSETAALAPLADVVELKRTVRNLRHQLSYRDQEALLSDLEIGHLPEEKGENVVHAVIVLAALLGVELEERDIVFAERVGTVQAPGSGVAEGTGAPVRCVVVRLARRSLCEDLLLAARMYQALSSDDHTVDPCGRIYVNERLTRENRQLYYRAREECREHQWWYWWTRRGRVFVRQADGMPAHQIRSYSDLQRIFNSAPI